MEVVLRILAFLLSIIHLLSRPYFWLISRRTELKIPSAKNPILELSAVVIAEKIRRKELSSETVVSAYIERIKEVNHLLNAVVENRFEAAIQEAKICDEKLAAGEVTAKDLEVEQPLYGVPMTVKESCGVKGLSYTGGSVARIGIKANYDGMAVTVLKNAGAIILCVTNTPELCLGFETINNLFGATHNPYNTKRSPGGSSGGEGALLASSASLIGIGSDIAGSIRLPATFNGIFGHKPTPGVISLEGHLPFVDDPEFKHYLTIGPLARYAEDLALAVRIMASKNHAALRLDIPVDVKSLKIRYMEEVEKSFGLIPVHEDVKKAVNKAACYLGGIGADVQRVNIKELKNSLELSLALLCGSCKLPQMLLNSEDPKHERNPFTEAGKHILGLSQYTISAIFCSLINDVNGFIPRSKLPSYRMGVQKLHQIFTDLLGTNGVFLYPTFVCTASYQNEINLQITAAMYCMIFNVLGFPSTNVPIGFDSKGLPVGIQVVSLPMQDRLCLAVAKELEKGFGGWIPPSSVPNALQR